MQDQTDRAAARPWQGSWRGLGRGASRRLGLALLGAVLPWPRAAHAAASPRTNVFGEPLQVCCKQNHTGFARTGYCQVTEDDGGRHAICAVVTAEFLAHTKAEGNDLSTPHPAWQFPGLQPGDRWCLCVSRWQAAERAGKAPPIDLAATDADVLRTVDLPTLQKYALKS